MLRPLPQFARTAAPGPAAPEELVAFVLEEYAAGRSLREIAELTDRSHGAVRGILARRGVHRRGPGAPQVDTRGRRGAVD